MDSTSPVELQNNEDKNIEEVQSGHPSPAKPTSTESFIEEPLSFVPDFYDIGEDADTESEMSEPDSPNTTKNNDSKVEEENQDPNGGKKRKKHDPTKRRKIRKLLTDDKLNTETLQAMKEEEERRKRLEEQALNRAAEQETPLTMKFNQPSNNLFPNSLMQPSGLNLGNSFLASLLTSKEGKPQTEAGKIIIPKPQQRQAVAGDVICISSDSDEEKTQPTKGDMIDISSDSSDDVIFNGEVDEEEPGKEDVNNSGMHIEDAKNQRDNQGNVLVNVNRPTNEPEIFLAPQLAAAVLPHQIGGIRFMFDNIVETLAHYDTSAGFGCILAHSMGLGKTLQVISFIEVFLRFTKARTVLVVVPVNTLLNWISEFNMWLPPKSKCLNENPAQVWPRAFSVHILSDIHKTVESRSKVVTQWYEEGGVLLLGYEMYRLLTSRKPRKKRRKKNSPKRNETTVINIEEEDRISGLSTSMQENLLKPGPDLIICDEGHRIKNSHASISQMLKNVRTRRRIVLTGYPLQNNLMEYWCMVDFVRPNFLGTKQEFSNMFERPILNGQCADSTEADVRLMRFRSHVLHSLLKGFVQRRSHSVLSESLPLKEEHVFMLRLSEWQKKLYNSFWRLKMSGSSGSWCSAINPIKAFSICCKIWNHPDVLYRTVREKTDAQESNDLDPDFDIPEVLDGLPNIKSRSQRKSPSNSNPQDLYKAAASAANGETPVAAITPTSVNPATPVSTVQQTGFNPFGEDRDKGMNYDWAKDLLAGYSTGMLEISGKMVVLMQIIHTSVAVGDRILVFSQSLSTLTLIEQFLSQRFVPRQTEGQQPRNWCKNESYFRLDGNSHTSDRERMINQFNSPDNKKVWLFLLSTRAGCLGINLIGANRVVVFDASWNPCHDAQAVCRIYRYGQRKTCHIYRLVCDQTMEKKIYERQVSKQGMSDRVVDKLNPTQIFTKQDVLSLMEFSEVELPKVNFDNVHNEYFDPILAEVCKMSGHWFTKKPFTHESLLLDCKDQRLTKAEKRAAEKSYERDKLASSACNYGRQSYAAFYGLPNSNNGRADLPRSASSGNFPPYSSQSHDSSRPIANVRPMQSTPLPMHLQSQNQSSGANQTAPLLHKSGISVQKVVATMDIPLPSHSTTTNTMAGGQPTKINAGETICIIRGRKGTYIRTSQGRIFAVRLNDASRFGSPPIQPSQTFTTSSSTPLMTSSASMPEFGSFRNSSTNFPPSTFPPNRFPQMRMPPSVVNLQHGCNSSLPPFHSSSSSGSFAGNYSNPMSTLGQNSFGMIPDTPMMSLHRPQSDNLSANHIPPFNSLVGLNNHPDDFTPKSTSDELSFNPPPLIGNLHSSGSSLSTNQMPPFDSSLMIDSNSAFDSLLADQETMNSIDGNSSMMSSFQNTAMDSDFLNNDSTAIDLSNPSFSLPPSTYDNFSQNSNNVSEDNNIGLDFPPFLAGNW